jgi:peptidoglycan/LPS O-acetylase OafA/YrhL
MYTFSVACIMVGVAWSSGFTLRVPMRNLVDTVLAWGAFGACGFPDVNGVSRTLLIAAGVHWTLTYEWAFYLALPLAASFRKPLPFAVMLVVCWFYAIHLGGYGAVVYFLVGMVVATVLRAKSPPAALRGPACGALALLLLFVGGYTMRNGHFGLPGVLLMSCFFYILASGNTLGGFLSSRPARVLGTASYSIYLMHGIVLFAVRSMVSIKDASPIKVFLFDAGCGLLMVIVSLLTYQWIEHPFIVTRAAAEPVAPPLPAVAIPSRV